MPRTQPVAAADATASANMEADLNKLAIDTPSAVNGTQKRLTATRKPIKAESIKAALTANRPKTASPLRTCETPGGSTDRSLQGLLDGAGSPIVAA